MKRLLAWLFHIRYCRFCHSYIPARDTHYAGACGECYEANMAWLKDYGYQLVQVPR